MRVVLCVGTVILDDGAAAEIVGVEVDRDDQAGAERARRRDRQRIDERAVHQPAAADAPRRKDSGQRIGRAHRLAEAAAGQPDFMAGADLGRDGREPQRQVGEGGVAEGVVEPVGEPAAADQPGAAELEVEIAEQAAAGEMRAQCSKMSSRPAA